MKTLEELKAALAAGTINLETFKAEAKKVLAADLVAGKITQEDHDAKAAEVEATQAPTVGGGGGGMTKEEISRMIQSETDKVRTQYAKQLKDAEDALEKIKREKMTDEEKAKDDLQKAQKALEEKETALQAREVALHTVDQLKAKNLPGDFRDILAGATVEDTDARITVFEKAWNDAINAAVQEKFKQGGGDPNKGKGGPGGDVNPWKKETFNMTKQAEILKSDPARAKALMAAAGV